MTTYDELQPAEKYYGRKIAGAHFDGDGLVIGFTDGGLIKISDTGQSCCEERFMDTDDEPEDLIGHTLRLIATQEAPNLGDPENPEDPYRDSHEVQFLEIATDVVSITFATHNKNNGYYSGFSVEIKELGK